MHLSIRRYIATRLTEKNVFITVENVPGVARAYVIQDFKEVVFDYPGLVIKNGRKGLPTIWLELFVI